MPTNSYNESNISDEKWQLAVKNATVKQRKWVKDYLSHLKLNNIVLKEPFTDKNPIVELRSNIRTHKKNIDFSYFINDCMKKALDEYNRFQQEKIDPITETEMIYWVFLLFIHELRKPNQGSLLSGISNTLTGKKSNKTNIALINKLREGLILIFDGNEYSYTGILNKEDKKGTHIVDIKYLKALNSLIICLLGFFRNDRDLTPFINDILNHLDTIEPSEELDETTLETIKSQLKNILSEIDKPNDFFQQKFMSFNGFFSTNDTFNGGGSGYLRNTRNKKRSKKRGKKRSSKKGLIRKQKNTRKNKNKN